MLRHNLPALMMHNHFIIFEITTSICAIIIIYVSHARVHTRAHAHAHAHMHKKTINHIQITVY